MVTYLEGNLNLGQCCIFQPSEISCFYIAPLHEAGNQLGNEKSMAHNGNRHWSSTFIFLPHVGKKYLINDLVHSFHHIFEAFPTRKLSCPGVNGREFSSRVMSRKSEVPVLCAYFLSFSCTKILLTKQR